MPTFLVASETGQPLCQIMRDGFLARGGVVESAGKTQLVLGQLTTCETCSPAWTLSPRGVLLHLLEGPGRALLLSGFSGHTWVLWRHRPSREQLYAPSEQVAKGPGILCCLYIPNAPPSATKS